MSVACAVYRRMVRRTRTSFIQATQFQDNITESGSLPTQWRAFCFDELEYHPDPPEKYAEYLIVVLIAEISALLMSEILPRYSILS